MLDRWFEASSIFPWALLVHLYKTHSAKFDILAVLGYLGYIVQISLGKVRQFRRFFQKKNRAGKWRVREAPKACTIVCGPDIANFCKSGTAQGWLTHLVRDILLGFCSLNGIEYFILSTAYLHTDCQNVADILLEFCSLNGIEYVILSTAYLHTDCQNVDFQIGES
jgi:hypothetical protein